MGEQTTDMSEPSNSEKVVRITIVTTPIGYVEAGASLMRDMREQQTKETTSGSKAAPKN